MLLGASRIGAEEPEEPDGIPSGAPASLKTVSVELPSNLGEAVVDLVAAKRLGKALFWDMQLGSDGVQACASCHFHAGADNRVNNQVNPGPGGFEDFYSGNQGPNSLLLSCDFPTHRLAVPDDNDSYVVHDVNDRVSSQGVFRRLFEGVDVTPPLSPEDDGTVELDPDGFSVGGINVRRVEPRNTPTTINSIFLHRIFWDGRANFYFNGNNPFGDTDPDAKVLVNDGLAGETADLVRMLFDRAATASQAVGPPLSPFEMSFDGRTWPEVGRKMLIRRPLRLQHVASTDSLLGPLDHPNPLLRGLNPSIEYADMVREAFHEKFWNAGGTYDAETGLPQAGEYTQMERNFALFFGLAILCYESTLVSDDSPYDRYVEGGGEGGTHSNALTEQEKEGLDIFLNRGECINCHSGPEFAGATLRELLRTPGENLIERMPMADGEADGHAQFVTYPPPIGEPQHPDDRSWSLDPRGKLIEIRPPTGYGPPLAWGWGYFSTGVNVCSPPIDETITLQPGGSAPADSEFVATARLRVDADCSKVFRVDMEWITPGAPGGDYKLFVAGAFVGTIHMDDVGEPAVYDSGFYNIGVRPTDEDLGAGADGPFGPFSFSKRAKLGEDVDDGNLQPPVGSNERIAVNGAFKTPSLRNVELTGPYMHNGGLSTLEQVVDFYTGGAHFEEVNKADLDPDVAGIGGMSPERKAALVAFLKALTDDRVRLEKAPFDHPELVVPAGHLGDSSFTIPLFPCIGPVCEALSLLRIIPAVGAEGRPSLLALRPFEHQLLPCFHLLTIPDPEVTETGGTVTQVRVSLSRQPASPVYVVLGPSIESEATVTPSHLKFTPENWNTSQLVLVHGLQDGVIDGNRTFEVGVVSVRSEDKDFLGIDGERITITSIDSGVVYETFQFEAEEGTPTSPMVRASDSLASGGSFLWVPNGTGNNNSTGGSSGSISLTFNVTAPGNYYVWALVQAPTSNDNAFWARMDSGTSFGWTLPVTSAWTWDKVNNSGSQDPVLWNLTAGNHSLRIRWREDGTKLDRVIVTSDPAYVPQTGHPIAP